MWCDVMSTVVCLHVHPASSCSFSLSGVVETLSKTYSRPGISLRCKWWVLGVWTEKWVLEGGPKIYIKRKGGGG